MKLFASTDHKGFWPVGSASIVVAEDEANARALLDAALIERGLGIDEPYTLKEVDTATPAAIILCDGNY